MGLMLGLAYTFHGPAALAIMLLPAAIPVLVGNFNTLRFLLEAHPECAAEFDAWFESDAARELDGQQLEALRRQRAEALPRGRA